MNPAQAPALAPAPAPGPPPAAGPDAPLVPARSSLWADAGAMVVTPLRLLWRHWPVLLTLGVGGVIGREAFLRAAVNVASVNAILGFLVFLMAPVSMMVAVALMLRAVRPSLVDGPGQPLLSHLGSALIALAAFYYAFGLLLLDFRSYSERLFDRYQGFAAAFEHRVRNDVRVERAGQTALLVAVVVVAFLGRRVLDRWTVAKRHPILSLVGAYLETVWITLGLLYLLRPALTAAGGWIEQRVVWHALADWWEGPSGPGHAYSWVDGWIVGAFPSGNFAAIFVVPLAGLAAALVIFGVKVPSRRGPRPGAKQSAVLRWLSGGAEAAADRWFAPLVLGVRAMARTGAAPLMVFCLAVATLQTGIGWLNRLEVVLIGPLPVEQHIPAFQESIDGVNTVLTLVLLACLLAAGADRIGRRVAAPDPTPDPAPGLGDPAALAGQPGVPG